MAQEGSKFSTAEVLAEAEEAQTFSTEDVLAEAEAPIGALAGAASTLRSGVSGILTGVGHALQYPQMAAEGIEAATGVSPLLPWQRPTVGALAGAGEAVVDAAESEALKPNPALEGTFWGDTLPRAAGSSAPFLLAGGLGNVLRVPSWAAPAFLGTASESVGQYYEALAHGGTEEQAWTAFASGHAIGATEALGVGGTLARADKASGGALKRTMLQFILRGGRTALREGAEEAVQETVQQTMANVLAAHIAQYDEDREELEGVLEGGQAGGLVGVLYSAVGSALGVRQRGGVNAGGITPDAAQVQEGQGVGDGLIAEGISPSPGLSVEGAPEAGLVAEEGSPTDQEGEGQPPLRVLHGTSESFDEFRPGGHGVVYFSEPEQGRKTQAEHIAEGPLGGRLVEAGLDLSQLKRFDPMNDPQAASVMDRLEAEGKVAGRKTDDGQWMDYVEYPEMGDIAPAAIEEGFSLFRVHEPSVQGFSLAVANMEAIQIAPDEGFEGEPEAVEAAPPATPTEEVSAFPGGLLKVPGVKAIRDAVKRNLTSKGFLPDEAFEANIKRHGDINQQVQGIHFALRDFERAVRKEFGVEPNKLPKAQLQRLDQVLRGGTAETVPGGTRAALTELRGQVDSMSRRLIASGVVEGDLALHVAENQGFYLTRSYQVFDDPKWADKVPVEVRNRAKSLIRAEYPSLTDEEVEGKIQAYLYEGKAAQGGPIAMLKEGKLGSKDLSILTRRKEISPEFRALYGEYKDPRVNYARSMVKMANLIANHQFLETVRDDGMGRYLFEDPIVRDGVEYKEQLASDGSAVMAPLNGLYTSPEIAQAFRDATESVPVTWWRVWLAINAISKTSKTVFNLITAQRNIIGNVGFATANAHWKVWEGKKSMRAVAEKWGITSDEKWRDYYRRALELGVIHEDTRSGEIQDVIKDATGQDFSEWLENRAIRAIKAPARLAIEYYRVGDDIWKLYAWENEKARYATAKPGWSAAEVEAEAARIVRNTYPTYSLVPRGAKLLRRFPLTGTFVSFPAEVFRTSKNTLAQIAKEMADPDLRGIGAQRLAGTAMAAASTGAMVMALRMLLGISADDDDDAREFVPEWSKHSDLAWLRWGDHAGGSSRYVDLSYTDPYSYLKEPVRALVRGDDWEEKVKDSAWSALEPFLSTEIMTQAAIEVRSNKKASGAEVYNPSDTATGQAQDIAGHLWDALKPGTLNSVERLAMGIRGEKAAYGREFDPKIEAFAILSGLRVNDFDVGQSLEFLARDYKSTTNKASRLATTVAQRHGTVSDADMRDAYERADGSRRAAFEDIQKAIRAARNLGLDEDAIHSALIGGGTGKKTAQALMAGQYQPYSLSSPTRRVMQKDLGDKEAGRRLEVFEKARSEAQP